MQDTLLDEIMRKKEEFEKTHYRTTNESIFKLWETVGERVITNYCDKDDQLDYKVDRSGITVDIITNRFAIIPNESPDLLDLFQSASICIINPHRDHKIHIHLWFNGVIWIEKNSCPSN